jgi:uncharacterized membrane protein YhhN
MMAPAFVLVLLAAVTDWLAVARGWRRSEMIFKPLTLLLLIATAWIATLLGPHDTWQAPWFIAGLAFSLAGDVFLLFPGRGAFVGGLVSFLIGHLCYIVGLNPTLPPPIAFALFVPIGAMAVVLVRGIAAGLRARGEHALVPPVLAYSVVLGLMLFSAWATLFRPEWGSTRRVLVVAGATLFFASDAMLAWERFVRTWPYARLMVIVTYHVGQVLLAASIAG